MKFRILLLLLIAYGSSSAQELLMPVIIENDSLISDTSEYYLYNDPLPAELFSLNSLVKLPDFDFDFELVIKLIRKGYRPVEIPINYRSRSFKEGKKVRVFRDPLTWIWALVKYRFAPIYEEK